MAAVLDAPVFPVVAQHLRGIGLFWGFAGNPIGELLAALAAFLVDGDALDPEGLSHMREVQVVIERGGNPDVARFDATMVGTIESAVIRFAIQVIKMETDRFEQLLLVAFDRKVIVGVALLDEVSGQFALGQQGVGRDGFAADVDGIKQGNGCLDLVGLFFLIAAGYRQGPHFFWV
jgi:hypothetical protein